MRGNWNGVWDSFDRRQRSKATTAAANDVPAEAADADMFARARVAAE